MIDMQLVLGALGLALGIITPVVVVVALGGVVAGCFSIVTRIEDSSINFLARLLFAVGVLYLAGHGYLIDLLDYSQGVWGRGSFYH